MRRHDATAPIPPDARGASIALGNFDGVHLGHQAVIAAARAGGEAKGAPLAVAVFEPHPRRFFSPDAPPFRLQSNTQRAHALANLGVAELYELRFDRALTQMSDRDFAERVLVAGLGAVHVSVGADFRFGRARMGDAESLARLGEELGFSVSAVSPVRQHEERISSSLIRAAIAEGRTQDAARMLGRPWAIEGEVKRGFARGRDFGFPTANISLGDYARPRLGIYAVRVRVGAETGLPGVASIGVNPTVGALPEPVLEAHLFDFDRELYGRLIEVELIAFLRDEAHFDSIEALKAQMREDARAARAALA